jgi:hypothetical protein
MGEDMNKMSRFLPKLTMLGMVLWASAYQPLMADAQIDNLISRGAKVTLPPQLTPAKIDGRVFSGDASAGSSSVQLNIPVLRCVTSHPPGDPFPGSPGTGNPSSQTYQQRAIADGIVTPACQVTLFVFLERLPGSPIGTISLQNLTFSSDQKTGLHPAFTLNDANAGLLTTPFKTGFLADANDKTNWNIVKFKMDSLNVSFGTPAFTPDNNVDDLFKLSQDPKTMGTISPRPGPNQVFMQFKSSPSAASGPMKYRIHAYAMIEFGAMAPIIFIHGTNADSTSWEMPTQAADEHSFLLDDAGKMEILDNSRMANPHSPTVIEGLAAKYAGPWFYKINLGPARLTDWDLAHGVVMGTRDRYCNDVPDFTDAFGNASNKFSADQLRVLIPLVLQMYGMGDDNWAHARCHLVAHSKGGSDCRYLITKTLPDPKKQGPTDRPFRVLGFFSLGTPFRGTPVSDISCALMLAPCAPLSNEGASPAVVRSIQSTIASVRTAIDSGGTPHGAALKDQSYNLSNNISGLDSRNITIDKWNDFNLHSGQYFSLAADADVDGDGQISGEESKVLSHLAVNLDGMGLTSIYQMMGTVSDNVQIVPVYEKTIYGQSAFIAVKNGTNFGTLRPNDLVAPYASCLPRELEGQLPQNQVPPLSRSSFRVTFRHPFLGYEFTPVSS